MRIKIQPQKTHSPGPAAETHPLETINQKLPSSLDNGRKNICENHTSLLGCHFYEPSITS